MAKHFPVAMENRKTWLDDTRFFPKKEISRASFKHWYNPQKLFIDKEEVNIVS